MRTTILGQLQIDHERGVIYFHADATEVAAGRCPTPLRIQGLGQLEYPQKDRQIDVGIVPIRTQPKIHTGTGKETERPMVCEVMVSK